MASVNRGIGKKWVRLNVYQSGQGTFEYLCVVAFSVIVLTVRDSDGNNVLAQLANAFKGFYNAFAFAISFSSTITPL